jgi:hypothetical protein
LEDKHVLVDQQAGRLTALACPAGLGELPKRGSRVKVAVADGGQQRDHML